MQRFPEHFPFCLELNLFILDLLACFLEFALFNSLLLRDSTLSSFRKRSCSPDREVNSANKIFRDDSNIGDDLT